MTHLLLIAFVVLISFPLLVIISISFRTGNFVLGDLIPSSPTLEHWALALGFDYVREDGTVITPPFPVLLWLWNSVKVAAISSACVVLLSTSSAYAFARLRIRFKGTILKSMLILQMFPSVLALVALFALFSKLGDYVPWLGLDSHGALIIASLGGMTMHIWTIIGYFDTLDRALEESAAIDGATVWQTFFHILLPLSRPILAVVFIISFIGTITEYPLASVLLTSPEQLTLAVGSQQYLYPQNFLWGDFAAAAILSGLPITILFLLCQRWIINGLTAGAVKG